MKNKKTEYCVESRILEAAKAVFIRDGLDGASMSGIARKAGITRTSLNYYFRTKEKLFAAVYNGIVNDFLPAIEAVALCNKPVFERIEEVVGIYTKMLLKNSGIVLFIANESGKNPQRYFEILESSPQILASAKRIGAEIKRNMDNGTLREMPLEYFATTFLGLLFFPFLGKNIISGIFFKGDEARFNKFVRQRQTFVVESIKSIFSPKE